LERVPFTGDATLADQSAAPFRARTV
jgi:hypothetical protein